MRISWTLQALTQLSDIREYISQQSKAYADRLVDRIIERTDQVEQFPESGRMLPELKRRDVRELIESGYRVIYRAGTEEITVLAVIHGAQNRPTPPVELP